MKINGASVDARYVETVVIPRGDSQFVFKARPLTAEDEKFFEEVCPKPQPPEFTIPGGGKEVDVTNAQYVKDRRAWSEKRSEFLFMRSLSATANLVWETVEEADSTTWGNLEEELLSAGFLNPEIITIFNAAIAANGLDSSKIEEATKSFLATQAAASD